MRKSKESDERTEKFVIAIMNRSKKPSTSKQIFNIEEIDDAGKSKLVPIVNKFKIDRSYTLRYFVKTGLISPLGKNSYEWSNKTNDAAVAATLLKDLTRERNLNKRNEKKTLQEHQPTLFEIGENEVNEEITVVPEIKPETTTRRDIILETLIEQNKILRDQNKIALLMLRKLSICSDFAESIKRATEEQKKQK